jgi:hypothetical protein
LKKSKAVSAESRVKDWLIDVNRRDGSAQLPGARQILRIARPNTTLRVVDMPKT